MSLRVIPVLDVQAGRAVHAVGGDRAHYRPLRGLLHPNADPIGWARAFHERLGLHDLYLADLDAIAGAPPSVGLYQEICAMGLNLWVDAGVRDAESLPPLLDSGVRSIIVGLESVRGPVALADIFRLVNPARVIFSLDLKHGRPLTAEASEWGTDKPRALADVAIRIGIRRLLLLDLSRVGTGRGVATLPLLDELADAYPGLEITVGGGIAGPVDLTALADTRASAVLVGSVLYDGRIGRDELAGR